MAVSRNCGFFCNRLLFRQCNVTASKTFSFRAASNRPRRAVLYVPGSSLQKLTKALTFKVDCIAMDCEDGVAINKKAEARNTIHSVLDRDNLYEDGPEISVRVNSVSSGLCADDIKAVLSAKHLPETLWLPKVETPDELQFFSEQVWNSLMKRPEAERSPINLGMLIESARAIMTLPDICSAAEKLATMAPIAPVALIFGSDDLLADLGATRSKTAVELLYARQRLVLVAKAFRLQAVDLVNIEYQNLNALQTEAAEGARMGYTGKQVIHPAQVPIVQEAFLPSKEALEWAQGLIAAFHEHQEKGQGAFTYRGSMIDMPLLRQAQNIVESSGS